MLVLVYSTVKNVNVRVYVREFKATTHCYMRGFKGGKENLFEFLQWYERTNNCRHCTKISFSEQTQAIIILLALY